MDQDREALFAHGVELFNTREFFECHEVLEGIWTPTVQPERWFLQSLIHFAVGFYHHQRGNTTGAIRQLRKGLRKIESYLPQWGGVDTAAIKQEVEIRLDAIETGRKFQKYPVLLWSRPYAGYESDDQLRCTSELRSSKLSLLDNK